MNKIKIIFVLAAALIIGLTGCSKKGADKIMGKWKAVDFADTSMKSMQIEVTYEFKKDSIINEGTVHGEPLPRMAIYYTVKSDDGKTMLLEATHPQSQQKGNFKLVLDGDKMQLTDPGNTVMTLQKQ